MTTACEVTFARRVGPLTAALTTATGPPAPPVVDHRLVARTDDPRVQAQAIPLHHVLWKSAQRALAGPA